MKHQTGRADGVTIQKHTFSETEVNTIREYIETVQTVTQNKKEAAQEKAKSKVRVQLGLVTCMHTRSVFVCINNADNLFKDVCMHTIVRTRAHIFVS